MSSSVASPAATAVSQQLDPIVCSSDCIELSPTSSRRMGRSQQSLIARAITDVTSQAMTNTRALDGQNNSGSINLEHGCQLRTRGICFHTSACGLYQVMRTPPSLRFLTSCLAVAAIVTTAPARGSQQSCRSLAAARQATERGWVAYRRNDIPAATKEFNRAVTLCPGDAGALTGAAYAAMRAQRLPQARALFARAVTADPKSYDAVSGAGMAAYQANDLPFARRSFERALQLVPGDSTARAYLARIPETASKTSLPTRVRPDTTSVVARAGKRIMEVRDRTGRWTPMWIKAVNLGAALPGKHPSEFPPNDGTYERWIELMA